LEGKGQLIKAKPGDLILWDSRTIHGGTVGKGYSKNEICPFGDDYLARLSFTICMTPKSWASE